MTRCALYRYHSIDGDLLYIGISVRPGARLSEHMAGSEWADQIANVGIEWFPSVADAFNAERAAIHEEKPLHNKQGTISPSSNSPRTAEKVRALRIASNCTQAGFAEMLGVNRNQLGHWETGHQRLSLDGALALREAFGVSLDWLYEAAP